MKSRYGVRRAIRELLSIFECQWSNGMLPQIRFMPGAEGYRPGPDDWGVTLDISGPTALRTSGITQPPIMGMCAYNVFQKLNEEERAAHAGAFLTIASGLERYHNWLLRERDPWGEHLTLCLHPWETGTDNSPAFDPLIDTTRSYIEEQGIAADTFGRADTRHVSGEHRPTDRDYFAYFGLLSLFKRHHYDQRAIIEQSPFLLQDVLFNSLLVVSLQSLASLQQQLSEISTALATSQTGLLLESAARNRETAHKVASAIRRKLWSRESGFFFSNDSRSNRLLNTSTVSGFMPLMGNIAEPQQAARLIARLANETHFWTEVPVPSTALSDPAFNPVRYWSGPSWPVTNWLVLRGLRETASPQARQVAEELRARTLAMIAEGNSDSAAVRKAAMETLELNSVGEEFTTPSRKQYAHGWLWDSAIVAVSWPSVEDKPRPYSPHDSGPRFWEYYHPHTGEPLGAPLMSWTASLFIELQDMGDHH